MTKCALCDQYYGPYSMEKHLEEDHSLKDQDEAYEEGYSEGRKVGEDKGYRDGYADATEDTDF